MRGGMSDDTLWEDVVLGLGGICHHLVIPLVRRAFRSLADANVTTFRSIETTILLVI